MELKCKMSQETDPLVERIGLSMWRVQRKIISGMSLQKELGLTFPQFALLNMISREGKARVVTLAERMEVKSSAVTVMLDRMDAIGLINREQDEKDRRAVVVSLTEKGRMTCAEGQRRSLVLLGEYLSILTPDELQRFADYYDMLDRQER
ncbi:MarR family transcriptional regulator [Paenibacillus sp. 7124]|uniref:MarR family transcriptional regulator n=2 Tax=Paenibacillus TaxID=44249 RepID=A0A6M1PFI1_9BACL|nr:MULTISPECIES: MarR family transcriptional regulator [Paenibacillus]AHV99455.1 MarR family transcriptional regulator [Paenibacillus sabinae T27]NGM82199.1 MarR family transcriptional regulator [Paenibacillus apii]NJJ39336.1 MarR family transcriptional regulator [Paenibacillus apii]